MRAFLLIALEILCLVSLSRCRKNNINLRSRRRRRRLENKNELKIIAFGGSTTYGAGLSDAKKKAYPYLLSDIGEVTNMAIRATGADYPSTCTQTMIGTKRYDIILLEFSLNGTMGLELLLKRLRKRFPDAIIIYVHLYNLSTQIRTEENKTPHELKTRDKSIRWYWNKQKVIVDMYLVPHLNKEVGKVNGHVYELERQYPPLNGVDLFQEDWHHLSIKGHATVAQGIKKLLKELLPAYKALTPRQGSWDKGDECYSWFHTGDVSIDYSGKAVVKSFAEDKYSLEFHGNGTVTVINHKQHDIPMYVAFMSWLNNYPPTRFYFEDGSMQLVDPRNTRVYGHIVRMDRIGTAQPGPNKIKIVPNPDKNLFKLPFRMTKIVMCDAGHYEIVNPALIMDGPDVRLRTNK